MSFRIGGSVGKALAVLVSFVVVSACTTIEYGDTSDRVVGSGTIVTQTRPIGDLETLVFASEGTVIIAQGEKPGLEIEADDNLQEYLIVEMDGPTLNIRTQSNIDIEPSQSIVFRIGAPDLATATMTGVGSVTMNGWNAPHITISITGTVDMDVTDLRATTLDVGLSGVGNLRLTGSVDDQTVEVSGTGSYMAGDLSSNTADVTLSGVGAATVWATERLGTELSGTGSVSYYGSPAVTGGPPSGTGSVTPLGSK
jgi:hypothetical protein